MTLVFLPLGEWEKILIHFLDNRKRNRPIAVRSAFIIFISLLFLGSKLDELRIEMNTCNFHSRLEYLSFKKNHMIRAKIVLTVVVTARKMGGLPRISVRC